MELTQRSQGSSARYDGLGVHLRVPETQLRVVGAQLVVRGAWLIIEKLG
jgi:hypothetical protein